MDSLSSAFSTASAIQQEQTNLAVQTSLMKKSLQVEKQIGEALVGLIEAANPSGSTTRTPGKAVGLGSNLDIFG